MKSYKSLLLAAVSIVVLGWVVTMAAIRTGAQWHPPAEQSGFAAWGTVLERDQRLGPRMTIGKETSHSEYLYVKFKTDAGVTFVIPFRNPDIEAIPIPQDVVDRDIPAIAATKEHVVELSTGSGSWVTCDNSGCRQPTQSYTVPASPATPAFHVHIPAIRPHGILRYHLCDGPFYCFDSWEDK